MSAHTRMQPDLEVEREPAAPPPLSPADAPGAGAAAALPATDTPGPRDPLAIVRGYFVAPEEAVRKNAVAALAAFDTPASAGLLIERALADDSPEVRRQAEAVIVGLSNEALGPVIGQLHRALESRPVDREAYALLARLRRRDASLPLPRRSPLGQLRLAFSAGYFMPAEGMPRAAGARVAFGASLVAFLLAVPYFGLALWGRGTLLSGVMGYLVLSLVVVCPLAVWVLTRRANAVAAYPATWVGAGAEAMRAAAWSIPLLLPALVVAWAIYLINAPSRAAAWWIWPTLVLTATFPLFMAAVRAGTAIAQEASDQPLNRALAKVVAGSGLGIAAATATILAAVVLLQPPAETILAGLGPVQPPESVDTAELDGWIAFSRTYASAWLILLVLALAAAVGYTWIDARGNAARSATAHAVPLPADRSRARALVVASLALVGLPLGLVALPLDALRRTTVTLSHVPDTVRVERLPTSVLFSLASPQEISASAPDYASSGLDLMIELLTLEAGAEPDTARPDSVRPSAPQQTLTGAYPPEIGPITLGPGRYRLNVVRHEDHGAADVLPLLVERLPLLGKRAMHLLAHGEESFLVAVDTGASAGSLWRSSRQAINNQDVHLALQLFRTSESKFAVTPFDPYLLSALCWQGSLAGRAQEVRDICDRAVEFTPHNSNVRDGRALNRALLGDTAAARRDFKFVVENPGSEYFYDLNQRREWLDSLSVGMNPFAPDHPDRDALLRSLR